jgi:hypothetical protein
MNDDNFTERNTKLPSHIAFSVKEGKRHRSHWQEVGTAWPAKDNGLTVKLDAIPLDGILILRSVEALERMRAERQEKSLQQDGQAQTPTMGP